MTAKRLAAIAVAAIALLLVVSFILFNSGGDEPGEGEGDRIEQPVSP